VPAQDVRCAVDAGAAAVRDAGYEPGPVVVVGHSAGAHLSSLAAFGDAAFRSPGCPYDAVEIDGWVGLSGTYDLRRVGDWAEAMMGGTSADVPDLYDAAATATYLVGEGPQHVRALVVQGDDDELLITTSVAEDLAALLDAHGYDTRLEIVPGDHSATYQAPVVADLLLDWLADVPD
jgi:acetyl esterase/lipase